MVALDLWVWGIALVTQMIAETVDMSTHPPSINGERFIHYANSKIYKEASYANIDMRKDDKHHVTDKQGTAATERNRAGMNCLKHTGLGNEATESSITTGKRDEQGMHMINTITANVIHKTTWFAAAYTTARTTEATGRPEADTVRTARWEVARDGLRAAPPLSSSLRPPRPGQARGRL